MADLSANTIKQRLDEVVEEHNSLAEQAVQLQTELSKITQALEQLKGRAAELGSLLALAQPTEEAKADE